MQTSPPVNQYTHHPSTTRNSLTGQETFTSTAYPKFEYRNAGFPQNLVFALSRFDSTKTGALTHEEVKTAVRFFEIGKTDEQGPWTIPFEAFPESMKQKLVEFDADGNGNLDAAEVEEALMALSRERNLRSRLVKALVALLIFTALLLLAMGLITFYVVDLAKEIKSNDNGVLTDASSGNAIRVASTDFQLHNGRLVSAPPFDCQKEGTCPTNDAPVQVKTASFASIVSSKLSVEDLQKLMTITAKSEDGESTVVLKVDGFARFPDITTQDGTTVELYTKHGVISLDGPSMHLDEKVSAIFTRAGIKFLPDSAASRRSISTSARRAMTSNDLVAPDTPMCIAQFELIRRVANAMNASGGELDLDDNTIKFPPGYKELLLAIDDGNTPLKFEIKDLASDTWMLSLFRLEGSLLQDLHLVAGSTPYVLFTTADSDMDGNLSSSEINALSECFNSVCFNRYPSDALAFIKSIADDTGGLSGLSDDLVDTFDLTSVAIPPHWRTLLQHISTNPIALEWTEEDWSGMTMVTTGERLQGHDFSGLAAKVSEQQSMLLKVLVSLDSDNDKVVDADASFTQDSFDDFRWAELVCRELSFVDGCANEVARRR